MAQDPSELELIRLCKQYAKTNSIDQIQAYFGRLVSRNKRLQLTESLRSVIPTLAAIQDGVLINVMNHTIDGLTPMHFVPDLTCGPQPPRVARTQHNPRRSRTVRDFVAELPVREILPKTSRRSKSERPNTITPRTMTARMKTNARIIDRMTRLPALRETDNDVIPQIYIGPDSTMYMCKREERGDLDMKILPPEYPRHKIGDTFSLMSNRGVVNFEGDQAGTIDLGQHFVDKTDEFLLERQMIRKKLEYRTFYHWIAAYKDRLFRKIVDKFDALNAVASPRFRSVMDRVGNYLTDALDKIIVYPTEFDLKNEDVHFTEYQELMDVTVKKIGSVTSIAGAEISRVLEEFFSEIRAVKVLMQLNFEELHSLSALPPALKKYSADLKWKTPSLYHERLRDAELVRQRELADRREEYLSRFFVRVNARYTGGLILKARDVIITFLAKFDSRSDAQRRVHKLQGFYDKELAIRVSPSKDEFQGWIRMNVERLKAEFVQNDKLINRAIITDIVPGFAFDFEEPRKVLERFTEVGTALDAAIKSSDEAYEFYETELQVHRDFIRSLMKAMKDSEEFEDLRDMEKLESVIGSLLQVKEELEQRPRNCFHKIKRLGETRVDFTVDMKPAWEEGAKLLDKCMSGLRERMLNELNNNLFSEIQDLWTLDKNKKITKTMCSSMEARMLMYSLMAVSIIKAWPEAMADCKAGLDTVMGIYQQLADKTKHTHRDAAIHFNEAVDKFGLHLVRLQDEEEDEEGEYEYEYEEEEKGDEGVKNV